MVLGAFVCMSNDEFEKNDIIVLDVFTMCQKLYVKKNIDRCICND